MRSWLMWMCVEGEGIVAGLALGRMEWSLIGVATCKLTCLSLYVQNA
jgi:hypothetical protein